MHPFIFRRHVLGSVNAELIKTGHWLVELSGSYALHQRERGKPVGRIIRGFPDKMIAYRRASIMVNRYYRLKGLLK